MYFSQPFEPFDDEAATANFFNDRKNLGYRKQRSLRRFRPSFNHLEKRFILTSTALIAEAVPDKLPGDSLMARAPNNSSWRAWRVWPVLAVSFDEWPLWASLECPRSGPGSTR